jgi:two-component sensor histidine kinase
VLAGPPVTISAVATQPVAMVLHELASNATRHGALAQPGGTLSLTWKIERGGGLQMVWEEIRGAPAPDAAPPGGLGSRILEATVQDQLGGRIERHWTSEGLRCVIRLPRSCLRAQPAPALA